jgi:hypothetical protein
MPTTEIRYDNASQHGGLNSVAGVPFAFPAGITSGDSGWINWIFTHNSSGNRVAYKNGLEINTGTGSSITFYNNPLWIGKSNFMNSSRLMFGSVRYYNRQISASEAEGNYAATKSRFGF